MLPDFYSGDGPWEYRDQTENYVYYGTYANNTYYQSPRVILETGEEGAVGTQQLYLISAVMEAYPPFGATLSGLPPGEFQIQGKTLVDSGLTNEDGAHWGQTLISVPAGTKPDITPGAVSASVGQTATYIWAGQDYYFNVVATPVTVDITANGIDLNTNNPPHFCVGQQITFSTNVGYTLGYPTTTQWTLDPQFYDTILPSSTSTGSTTNAMDPTLLTNSILTNIWYYGAPGLKKIQCTVNVSMPTGQSVALTSHGYIWVYSPQVIAFVTNPPYSVVLTDYLEIDRMEFFAAVQSATNFPGQVNWIQLINRSAAYAESTGGGFWLDNGLFYNTVSNQVGTAPLHTPIAPRGTINFNDSPGVNNLPYASCTDSFQTYLVFQPQPYSNSIWVNLGIVTWGWSGSRGFTSTLTSSNVIPPAFSNSYVSPVWTNTIHNK